MISPFTFTTEMRKHWTEGLGNVSSQALEQSWHQLAVAFGKHINVDSIREQWTVLQPPTGSGKSQGTAVYCSLLAGIPMEQQPGVLIVTRLKADADEMAKLINKLAGKEAFAVAYHSDSKALIPLETLEEYPVVIITHKAYELALDHLGHIGRMERTFPYFHRFNDGDRKLVIIDESLDIIEHSQGELAGLRQTIAAIEGDLRADFPDQFAILDMFVKLLEEMSQSEESNRQPVIPQALIDGLLKDEPLDFRGLRQGLKIIRFDHALKLGINDKWLSDRARTIHEDRIKSVDNIIRRWAYYAKEGKQHSLNNGRLLVPEGIKGAVVLDATASANVIYKLFDRAEIITPPEGVRNYRNVSLFVSEGHNVGKYSLTKAGIEDASKLIAQLNPILKGKDVFLCCHKDVEAHFKTFEPDFNLSLGHWGAVDGSNQWKDCDTAVIYGLPYKPNTWAPNVYLALTGGPKVASLWEDHKDIRQSLETGQIISDVVQAINRIRSRKVIDESGNCPISEVYIALPKGRTAKVILEGIERLMPGIQVKDWQFKTDTKKPRKSKLNEAIFTYLDNMEPGRIPASSLKSELKISDRTYKRFTASLSTPDSIEKERLTQKGITYELGKNGTRSYFTKR